MGTRHMLTLAEREEIALAHARGDGVRAIARLTGPVPLGHQPRAGPQQQHTRLPRHHRPQTRNKAPQTPPTAAYGHRARAAHPRAARLKLEARGENVEPMEGSIPAGGERISHEALYTWIYALPKGALARLGVMLPSKRGARRPRRKNGLAGGRIVGMRSIRECPEQAQGRRVPGHWEGDLIIGKEGKSAAITLVDRQSRFTMILALPQGKSADHVADVLIDSPGFAGPGAQVPDLGTEMGRHAAVTVATDLPVFFADAHSPWQRPTNENTNRLIREYLPKGTDIVQHQLYLSAIAEELNTRRRACLGFYTPQEVFHRMLLEVGALDDSGSVASTN